MLGAVTEHFRLCSIVIMRQILILLCTCMYILCAWYRVAQCVYNDEELSNKSLYNVRACLLAHDYNFDSFLFFLRLILHDLKVLV